MDSAVRLGAFDIGGVQPINGHLYNVIPASPARTRSPTRHLDIAAFTSSDPPAVHTTGFIYEWTRPDVYVPSISVVYSRYTTNSRTSLMCRRHTHDELVEMAVWQLWATDIDGA